MDIPFLVGVALALAIYLLQWVPAVRQRAGTHLAVIVLFALGGDICWIWMKLSLPPLTIAGLVGMTIFGCIAAIPYLHPEKAEDKKKTAPEPIRVEDQLGLFFSLVDDQSLFNLFAIRSKDNEDLNRQLQAARMTGLPLYVGIGSKSARQFMFRIGVKNDSPSAVTNVRVQLGMNCDFKSPNKPQTTLSPHVIRFDIPSVEPFAVRNSLVFIYVTVPMKEARAGLEVQAYMSVGENRSVLFTRQIQAKDDLPRTAQTGGVVR